MDYLKTVVVTVALVVAIMSAAEGQDIPSCASSLVPCAGYLNYTTKPPPTCCDPLKDAVNKQLTCLCNLYNDPTLLKTFKINVTDALRLPTLCGVPGDLCQGGKNSSTPLTPAAGANDNGSSPKNSAGKSAPTALFSGLLIWASVMLY